MTPTLGARRAIIVAASIAYIDNGVRLFCLTDAGNATRWQVLELVVRRWGRIGTTALNEVGPYINAVTLNDFRRIA